MKKIFALLASVVITMTACANNDQLISYSSLPVQAQAFIQKYFNATDVVHVERERDGLHYEYGVTLKNTTKIDFDHQGNLESIDCRIYAVPEGIVPELIVHYTTLHYPDSFIVEYAIEYRRLKVELSNGLDLIFDIEGNYIGMDD
jgi:hypothetical protein